MTVYNESNRKLIQSIESVLKQTYRDFLFVIVDDFSQDDSLAIIEKYSYDSRIIVHKNMSNIGRAASLNVGLSYCTSDYVLINDADDISLPNRLSEINEFITNSNFKNITLVGSGFNFEIEPGNYKQYYNNGKTKKISIGRSIIGMPFIHSSVVYNQKKLNALGGFTNELKNAIDYFTLIKLSNRFGGILRLNKVLVNRTIDGNNFFMKINESINRESYSIIDNWVKKNVGFGRYYLFLRWVIEHSSKHKKKISKFRLVGNIMNVIRNHFM